MARTFRRKERLSAMSEINMTPLIDLAFALLIIFMITTPLMEQAIELELPQEEQKQQNRDDAPELQVISVDAKGRYFWGDEAVEAERLKELLGGLSVRSPETVLSIRADRRLPYQNVITLIDIIKQQGLTKIDLPTQVE